MEFISSDILLAKVKMISFFWSNLHFFYQEYPSDIELQPTQYFAPSCNSVGIRSRYEDKIHRRG